MKTVNIKLTKEQADRLSSFLDNHIFSDIADIAECVGYQVDYEEFKECKSFKLPVQFEDDLPSFFNPNK